MDQGLELFLLCFWGGVLGFIYSLCNALVRKRPKTAYGVWTICGVLIFLSTAYFLFRIANGSVGIYGFPVMILGFFLFLHFIYRPAAKATRSMRRQTGRCFLWLKKSLRWVLKGLLLPFALLVKSLEKVIIFLQSKLKIQRKKEDCHEES